MTILLYVVLTGVYLAIGIYTCAKYTWCFGYVNNPVKQNLVSIGLILLFPLFYIWLLLVIMYEISKMLLGLNKK